MALTQADIDAAVEKAIAANNVKRDADEAGLKASNEKLLSEKKTESAKAKEAQDMAVKAAEESAQKSGDVEAINKSWEAKFEKFKTDSEATIAELNGNVNNLTAGAARSSITAELALKGSEVPFGKIIENRVGVEMRDGVATTVFNDIHGKPSAATREEFIKELREDASMKPFLSGSQGSGGGAVDQGGGAVGTHNKDFGGSREERTTAIAARFPDLK